ncbi:recombination protein RecR [Schaalia cardiffensis]|uniref:recombination mediator RecR n=1 Tax=Schaalia cardiffensis TaxID=181487 RepID=UPI0018E733A9|nr:recombination mediator RecR [Schaalia cardiffensis]MBJ2329861.1 recombination protein RecR [Schaalia cardiffensis]
MYEGALQDLIDEFGRLPGIGPKSAQRMAMHVLDSEPDEVARLVDAIQAVRKRVHHCEICGNLTEEEACSICRDSRRDPTTLCVVQEPKDIQAIEGSRVFHGRYHVLGGVIDPIHGIGPDQLRIRQLLTRLQDDRITEVIIATNPNVEGEATAAYLARTLATIGITTSRLAMGLPMGGDLEYADSITLGRALEGRRSMA